MTQPESSTGSTDRASSRRHAINLKGIEKRVRLLQPHLESKITAARKSLLVCNSLKLQSLGYAAQVLVLEPESPEVCRWLRIASQAVVAIFEGAMVSGDEIEVQLGDGPPVRVPSTVSPGSHHVGNWTDAFFMAAACRDRGLVDALCGVPIEILRSSSTRGTEDSYLFAEALRCYWTGEGSAAERAEAALRAAGEPDLPAPVRQATEELSVPEIQVLQGLLAKDAAGFNESLALAVKLHREFWSRDEDLARDPDGYFSLTLTGLAALAHDAGIPITVESDYLPMMLVRGDCRPA